MRGRNDPVPIGSLTASANRNAQRWYVTPVIDVRTNRNGLWHRKQSTITFGSSVNAAPSLIISNNRGLSRHALTGSARHAVPHRTDACRSPQSEMTTHRRAWPWDGRPGQRRGRPCHTVRPWNVSVTASMWERRALPPCWPSIAVASWSTLTSFIGTAILQPPALQGGFASALFQPGPNSNTGKQNSLS